MQYYGWRAGRAAGCSSWSGPGRSLACRDILGGRLAPGSVLEPRLSYDGKRDRLLLRASAGRRTRIRPPSRTRSPTRATSTSTRSASTAPACASSPRGPYDDLMPSYLPDGGIVVRLDAPAQGLLALLRAAVQPALAHLHAAPHGRRRDRPPAALRQRRQRVVPRGLERRPDPLRPLGLHRPRRGDAPEPLVDPARRHQPDGRLGQRHAEAALHVPGASRFPGAHKIVFIASAHHSITGGPVSCSIPTVDPNGPRRPSSASRRRSRSPRPRARTSAEYYESPWPLSERLFPRRLQPRPARLEGEHRSEPNPDNALGIYLLDARRQPRAALPRPGDRQHEPDPARPRARGSPAPCAEHAARPIAPPTRRDAHRSTSTRASATCRAGRSKELRIVQIFPKTTSIANSRASASPARRTPARSSAPCRSRPDGSARFLVPAHEADPLPGPRRGRLRLPDDALDRPTSSPASASPASAATSTA